MIQATRIHLRVSRLSWYLKTPGVLLHSAGAYQDAVNEGRLFSSFLRVPLEDSSSEHSIKLKPGDTRQVLESRLSEPAPQSPQPAAMASQVIHRVNRLEIVISKKHNILVIVIPAVVVITFALVFGPPVVEFFKETQTPNYVQYIFLGFFGMIIAINLIGLPFKLRRAKTTGTSLAIDGISLIIEDRNLSRVKRTVVPLSEVLDVDFFTADGVFKVSTQEALQAQARRPVATTFPYEDHSRKWWYKFLKSVVKSQGIVIKSKSGMYFFGSGLSDEEVKYLYSLIRNVIITNLKKELTSSDSRYSGF
jgi:hypothetical protein